MLLAFLVLAEQVRRGPKIARGGEARPEVGPPILCMVCPSAGAETFDRTEGVVASNLGGTRQRNALAILQTSKPNTINRCLHRSTAAFALKVIRMPNRCIKLACAAYLYEYAERPWLI